MKRERQRKASTAAVGVDSGGPSAASKSTQHDRVASAGTISNKPWGFLDTVPTETLIVPSQRSYVRHGPQRSRLAMRQPPQVGMLNVPIHTAGFVLVHDETAGSFRCMTIVWNRL
ncbi:hypothetical protein Y032_0004g2205 [Ancylostoma ceylanicum]|nr:hypothetical protein Y032_0004g2205 [Ancylostoma ceylanicum]